MASHFQAHSDSQLGPTLVRLILQMQYVEKGQTGMEREQRKEEGEERIDRKGEWQLKKSTTDCETPY